MHVRPKQQNSANEVEYEKQRFLRPIIIPSSQSMKLTQWTESGLFGRKEGKHIDTSTRFHRVCATAAI